MPLYALFYRGFALTLTMDFQENRKYQDPLFLQCPDPADTINPRATEIGKYQK
jgi:hypothetical protein